MIVKEKAECFGVWNSVHSHGVGRNKNAFHCNIHYSKLKS